MYKKEVLWYNNFTKKQYQRKDFLMKTIISQKLLNVIKNKKNPIISLELFNDVGANKK